MILTWAQRLRGACVKRRRAGRRERAFSRVKCMHGSSGPPVAPPGLLAYRFSPPYLSSPTYATCIYLRHIMLKTSLRKTCTVHHKDLLVAQADFIACLPATMTSNRTNQSTAGLNVCRSVAEIGIAVITHQRGFGVGLGYPWVSG